MATAGPPPSTIVPSVAPSRRRARHLAMVVVLAVLALVSTSCLLHAPTDPGPLRFRDEVFTAVTKTANVAYGQAVSQAGQNVTLRFDLYEPTGDEAPLRPLVIWIHGGSFAFGSRTSPEIVDQANIFARKGYVNASISYRLSERGCTVVDVGCIESMVDATEDAQAAVRYFRANAETYGIDPDRIAISGTSAGAITALHVGYRAQVPGNSGTPGPSSDVRAAVSFSGARLLGNCDTGDAPALLLHGSADSVVPYAWAQNTITCAHDADLWAHLTTWEGDGHVPYTEHREQIIEQTTNFLFNSLQVRPLIP